MTPVIAVPRRSGTAVTGGLDVCTCSRGKRLVPGCGMGARPPASAPIETANRSRQTTPGQSRQYDDQADRTSLV